MTDIEVSMCKFNPSNGGRRIDPCMLNLVEFIRTTSRFNKPVACCCGHGRYLMTILVKNDMTDEVFDIVSLKQISRKRRFYKRDEDGYYYVPEVKPDIRSGI